MKLATYKDGSRDGQLVVVSRDLARAHFATGIATRLQQVLDDWNFITPQLQQLYDALNRGQVRHAFDFDPRLCAAPLPRAFQVAWATVAGTAQEPDAPAPLRLELAAGDALLGARDIAEFASDGWDIDAEAGLAVLTGDIGAGTPAAQASEGVRLLTLMCRWRLRALDGADAGFSPAPAFGPVAVTPDELQQDWDGARVRAQLQWTWNQRRLARRDAAEALPWPFGQPLARLAHTRMLQAGCIVGCAAQADAPDEAFSLQALRALEAAGAGTPRTGFLRHGDRLRLELLDARGQAPLGAIEQAVAIGRG
ncbi:fumarylacetoacetate hydrolase family protein [Azohydromonas caseinilytica]|uniref:Fumarylacetoacetate hydrolase n=1 Tax=Azohydromonas caseinilytica TaxID=2728836 RepID=A0A848F534_9BURK|nr:fumarylacetoacetate hydrolase family protein [Azohydromonas caseinilytica]NML13815.1 fumarylacetoacetate hydrolase [Azohydromonas caseinilytica]